MRIRVATDSLQRNVRFIFELSNSEQNETIPELPRNFAPRKNQLICVLFEYRQMQFKINLTTATAGGG